MKRPLLLVGVAQGWLLWGLWKAHELKVWPASDPVSMRALLYLGLALPLAIYLTEDIGSLARGRRIKLLVLVSALFIWLGAYSGWADGTQMKSPEELLELAPARPADLLAAAVLGFILIPLCVHFDYSAKRWPYKALFESAWRNALLAASSGALTGVFWIVLFAGAMLMKSIGVEFVLTLIQKPVFWIPATSIVFAAAFGLGLARAEMIVSLRRFWLSISAWFLPLLMAFSLIWVAALPFTGVSLLFKTHNAAFILLWFIALSIHFANAAYQDGTDEQPYGPRLSKGLEFAWLSLLVLAVIAWWAMTLRIGQYGWTEERVLGIFVMLLASCYTAGYSYSLKFRHGWLANIGLTNIATALVMAAGIVLLLSPLADARRIAVQSQLSRLMDGTVEAEKIDYAYLRWQAGRYGVDALKALSAGMAIKDKDLVASKAKQILAQKQRYATGGGAEALSVDQLRQRFRVLPQGDVLDDSLIKMLQSADTWQEKRCLAVDAHCLVWFIDLDGDGLKDAVVIVEAPGWQADAAVAYRRLPGGQYRHAGTVNLGYGADKALRDGMLSDIEHGNVKTVSPRFNDILVGGRRVQVIAEPCTKPCAD